MKKLMSLLAALALMTGCMAACAEDAPEEPAGQVDLTDVAMVDKALDNPYFIAAPEDCMTMEEAYRLILDVLSDEYDVSREELMAYAVEYGYNLGDDWLLVPNWQFDLFNDEDGLDGYEIMIDASTGEVLYMAGPGEGNG